MRVRIYNVDQNTGAETLTDECDLATCFEADDSEFSEAARELLRHGRFWCGGGASPFRLLMLVKP